MGPFPFSQLFLRAQDKGLFSSILSLVSFAFLYYTQATFLIWDKKKKTWHHKLMKEVYSAHSLYVFFMGSQWNPKSSQDSSSPEQRDHDTGPTLGFINSPRGKWLRDVDRESDRKHDCYDCFRVVGNMCLPLLLWAGLGRRSEITSVICREQKIQKGKVIHIT